MLGEKEDGFSGVIFYSLTINFFEESSQLLMHICLLSKKRLREEAASSSQCRPVTNGPTLSSISPGSVISTRVRPWVVGSTLKMSLKNFIRIWKVGFLATALPISVYMDPPLSNSLDDGKTGKYISCILLIQEQAQQKWSLYFSKRFLYCRIVFLNYVFILL